MQADMVGTNVPVGPRETIAPWTRTDGTPVPTNVLATKDANEIVMLYPIMIRQ